MQVCALAAEEQDVNIAADASDCGCLRLVTLLLASSCSPFPHIWQIFHQKHAAEKKGRWVCGNAVFFRMNRILDIYFVGGFGTVQVRPGSGPHGGEGGPLLGTIDFVVCGHMYTQAF